MSRPIFLQVFRVLLCLHLGYLMLAYLGKSSVPLQNIILEFLLALAVWIPRKKGLLFILTFFLFSSIKYLYFFLTTFLVNPMMTSSFALIVWFSEFAIFTTIAYYFWRIRLFFSMTNLGPRLPSITFVALTLFVLMSSLLPMGNINILTAYQSAMLDQVIKAPGNIEKGAISPDGRQIALIVMGKNFGTKIVIVDIDSKQIRGTLIGTLAQYNNVVFSPDGRYLAGGGISPTTSTNQPTCIDVWDIASGVLVSTPKKIHAETKEEKFMGIESIAFSPDSKNIVYGSQSGINIWDLGTGDIILIPIPLQEKNKPINAHNSSFNVSYAPDGALIAAARNSQITVLDAKTREKVATMECKSWRHHIFIFSPDGKMLANGPTEHGIEIWDVRSGQKIKFIAYGTEQLNTATFSPNGKYLALGGNIQQIKIADLSTGSVRTIKGLHPFVAVTFLAFSPNNLQLYSGGGSDLKIWKDSI